MKSLAKQFLPSILLAFSTFATSGLADDVRPKQLVESAIKPVVRDVENAIQGKPHRPIEEFVAKDATFQGRKPLHEMLNVPADKAKPFPKTSTLHWLELSALTPREVFEDLIPADLDAEKTVLVFRDMNSREDRTFRILYWLSERDGRWLIVYGADGWMPSEPLASVCSKLTLEADDKQGSRTKR